MATQITDKSKKEDKNGLQLQVTELGLGAKIPGATPTCTISGVITAAGTGASSAGVSTGGVANKVIAVDVAGTVYYLPLFSSNA